MSKRALVTGGSGFLGRHLIERLLQEGHDVVTLNRGQYSDLERRGVTCLQGDLASQADVQRACDSVDVVFHAAAKTGPWGKYDDFHRTNVIGTDNVIKACLAQGVRRLVYTSTPSVLSFANHLSGVDESHPFPNHMVSAYQHTKMLAETQVLGVNGQRGLTTTALRPHAIWGPGDNHFMPVVIERHRQGQLKQIGNGRNKISISYVENTAQAHLLASRSEHVAGKVYFVNEPHPVEMWGWLNQMFAAIGLPPVSKSVPYPVAYAAGWVAEKVHGVLPFLGEPKLNRAVAALLGRDHYFDTTAAVRDFGLNSNVSIEEGIQRFAINYKRP